MHTQPHTRKACVWLCHLRPVLCVCPGLESSLSARSRQPGTPLTTTAALEQLSYGSNTHTDMHSWMVLMQSPARRHKETGAAKFQK